MNGNVVESLMIIISLAIILILSMILFVFLVASLFPRLMLKLKSPSGKKIKERGIKKMLFEGGRSVVYEPDVNIRQYVYQYTLVENGGSKFIKCKINEKIRSIRYELAVFDGKGKMIDVIGVAENIAESGYTRSVTLPHNTSYVVLSLKKASGVDVDYTDKEKVAVVPTAMIFLYLCSVVLSSVGEMLLLKYIFENIFGRLQLGIIPSEIDTARLVISAALVGAVSAALIIIRYTLKSNKVVSK